MSDYFTRLAERALGATQLPRPALPTPFEPVSQAGFEEIELDASPPRVTARQVGNETSPDGERAPVMGHIDSGSEHALNTPARHVVEPPRSDGESIPLPQQPAAEAPAPVTTERVLIHEHQRDIVERRSVVVESSSAASPPGETVVSVSSPRQIEARPIAQSPAVANFSEARLLEDDAAAPAIVQVTIGRVDVRAVTPPAPARERLRPPRPARPSLEDYLRGGRP